MNTPKDKSDTKTARTKNNRLPDRTAVLIPAYEPETAMLILRTEEESKRHIILLLKSIKAKREKVVNHIIITLLKSLIS